MAKSNDEPKIADAELDTSTVDEGLTPEEQAEQEAEAKRVAELNADALKKMQKDNAKLREELKAEKAAREEAESANAVFDPEAYQIGGEIVDADIVGGPAPAPELPDYPEGAVKTFVLEHDMGNSTPEGVKRYKAGVKYTLDAQTADDLVRRDKDYARYERTIHIRENLITDAGTISGNG